MYVPRGDRRPELWEPDSGPNCPQRNFAAKNVRYCSPEVRACRIDFRCIPRRFKAQISGETTRMAVILQWRRRCPGGRLVVRARFMG